MVYRIETFREDSGIVVLQPLKVSHLSNIPYRFYTSPKLKNWMCELCKFLQIRSHMYTYLYIAMYTCFGAAFYSIMSQK